MRWVVCAPGPVYSVYDAYVGWVEALRNLGQHVITFNLDDRLALYGAALKQVGENTFTRMLTPEQSYELAVNGLYSTLFKARPDILLIVSGFFIPPDLLDRARRSGTRTVVLYTEVPYENDRQFGLAQFADLNLVDDPIAVDEFAQFGPTMFIPRAYRPTVHCPGPSVPELACDLAFVGTGYPSRVAFLEAMDLAGLDVLLAGNWQTVGEDSPLYPFLATDPDECLDNDKTVQVYRSAKVGLNLYRKEAQRPELSEGWACGPREIEMAACSLFFLRESRPESDQVLGMLPSFTTPDEASELLRYWLARPDERAALAAKARETVADRTFERYAADVLRVLET